MNPSAWSARLAAACGFAAVALVVLGLAAAYWGWLGPFLAFRIFALGLVPGSVLALVLGLVGLVRTRSGSGRGGRSAALFGAALGASLLAVLLALVLPQRDVPPIHDITTDPTDAPTFQEIARLPANAGRDLTYPHGGEHVTELQRQAYPDLEPLVLDRPTAEVFGLVRAVVDELGWTVVWANAELGQIEATATSGLFRFVDDVVVRVRESPAGTVVDVRSTSRVGLSDLGANAARIRSFLAATRSRAGQR